MAQFTLLELHLDDAEFTANTPFSSSDDDGSASKSRWSRSRTETSDETDDEASGGRNVGRLALAAIGVVVLVALVLRLYLGGSEDGVDSVEDL